MPTRFSIVVMLAAFAMLPACIEDLPPLIGVELDPNKIVGEWEIENFTRNDSIRTPDFEGVVLLFDISRQLFIDRNNESFEAIWSLRAQDLLLSVDVSDTILRELSGVYVSQEEQDSLQLNLTNKNPRTPGSLILVRR